MSRQRRQCHLCTRPAVYRNGRGKVKTDREHDLCARCWDSVNQSEHAKRLADEQHQADRGDAATENGGTEYGTQTQE